MKAFLYLHLLIIFIYAYEQNTSQLLPSHYYDLLYDIHQCSNKTKQSIKLLSSDIAHEALVKSLIKSLKKEITVTLYLSKTLSNKKLALLSMYRNLHIFIIDDLSLALPESLIIFDDETALSCSLPLVQETLQTQAGSYKLTLNSDKIKVFIQNLEALQKNARPYFIH